MIDSFYFDLTLVSCLLVLKSLKLHTAVAGAYIDGATTALPDMSLKILGGLPAFAIV
jgi:hypothetical protein